MNFEVLEYYTLFAIFVAQLFLNLPGFDSILFYIIIIVSFLVYYLDSQFVVFNRHNIIGSSSGVTPHERVNVTTHEINEVVESTTKYQTVIVNEMIFISKP
jgi:hypothetical protein